MHYYKRNLGDFARDTAHLSQSQIGAYDLLLDWYYANERPLPADKADVYRIARAFSPAEKKATDKVLADFFAHTEDGWMQKRAMEELARYAKQRETNRVTGRLGGRPKKGTEWEPNNNRIGFDSETEREPINNPNTESSNTEKAKAKSLGQQAARKTADRFAEFWAVYPVKKGRAEAEAKWRIRGLDAIADTIIDDVRRRAAKDRQWLDGYAPHGSTYVNSRGWEDDIEAQRQPAHGASSSAGAMSDILARAV